jgi:integrase
MTIYRQGAAWRYDFTLSGTRYTRRGYRTKTDAQQAEAQHRNRILVGLSGEWQSFAALVADWLDSLKDRNVSTHYQTLAVGQFDKWLAPLAKVPPREIKPLAIQRLLGECARQTSPQNANAVRRQARAAFSWACRLGGLERNPVAAVPPFREPERRADEVQAIPGDDLRSVMLAAEPWLRRLLTVQALTGARWVEIVRLRPEDCELETDPPAVWLRHHKGGERSRRRVLPAAAAAAIRSQLRRGNAMWLWPGRPGTEHRLYDGCLKQLHAACDRAGVRRYGFHAVRRWAATQAMALGIPDRVAAEFLGHADASVIHRYQRVEDALVVTIGDALAATLPGVTRGVDPTGTVRKSRDSGSRKGGENA